MTNFRSFHRTAIKVEGILNTAKVSTDEKLFTHFVASFFILAILLILPMPMAAIGGAEVSQKTVFPHHVIAAAPPIVLVSHPYECEPLNGTKWNSIWRKLFYYQFVIRISGVFFPHSVSAITHIIPTTTR